MKIIIKLHLALQTMQSKATRPVDVATTNNYFIYFIIYKSLKRILCIYFLS